MTLQDILDASPNVLTFIAAVLMGTFTILWRVFFNVTSTPTGRAFGQFSAALSSVLFLGVALAVFGPNYPLRWLFRDIVLVWIITAVVRLLMNLYRKWHSPEPIVFEPRPRRSRTDSPRS